MGLGDRAKHFNASYTTSFPRPSATDGNTVSVEEYKRLCGETVEQIDSLTDNVGVYNQAENSLPTIPNQFNAASIATTTFENNINMPIYEEQPCNYNNPQNVWQYDSMSYYNNMVPQQHFNYSNMPYSVGDENSLNCQMYSCGMAFPGHTSESLYGMNMAYPTGVDTHYQCHTNYMVNNEIGMPHIQMSNDQSSLNRPIHYNISEHTANQSYQIPMHTYGQVPGQYVGTNNTQNLGNQINNSQGYNYNTNAHHNITQTGNMSSIPIINTNVGQVNYDNISYNQENSTTSNTQEISKEEKFSQKASQWKKLNMRRFGLGQSAQVQHNISKILEKHEVDPEILRRIVQDRGDMTHRKFRRDRHLFLGGLKYFPYAMLRLLESMPFPWEKFRRVPVVFHKSGAFTYVDDARRVAPPQYLALWGIAWELMRAEKRNRENFMRLKYPCFDDQEPILSYTAHIANLDAPGAITLELAMEEDACLRDTMYQLLTKKKKYRFTVEQRSVLYQYSSPIIDPIRRQFLFDIDTFKRSKALGLTLPGGPKFQPLYPQDKDEGSSWREFNDIGHMIFRGPVVSEYRLHFPYLLNSDVRGVQPFKCLPPVETFRQIQNADEEPFGIGSGYTPLLAHSYSRVRIEIENECGRRRALRLLLGDDESKWDLEHFYTVKKGYISAPSHRKEESRVNIYRKKSYSNNSQRAYNRISKYGSRNYYSREIKKKSKYPKTTSRDLSRNKFSYTKKKVRNSSKVYRTIKNNINDRVDSKRNNINEKKNLYNVTNKSEETLTSSRKIDHHNITKCSDNDSERSYSSDKSKTVVDNFLYKSTPLKSNQISGQKSISDYIKAPLNTIIPTKVKNNDNLVNQNKKSLKQHKKQKWSETADGNWSSDDSVEQETKSSSDESESEEGDDILIRMENAEAQIEGLAEPIDDDQDGVEDWSKAVVADSLGCISDDAESDGEEPVGKIEITNPDDLILTKTVKRAPLNENSKKRLNENDESLDIEINQGDSEKHNVSNLKLKGKNRNYNIDNELFSSDNIGEMSIDNSIDPYDLTDVNINLSSTDKDSISFASNGKPHLNKGFLSLKNKLSLTTTSKRSSSVKKLNFKLKQNIFKSPLDDLIGSQDESDNTIEALRNKWNNTKSNHESFEEIYSEMLELQKSQTTIVKKEQSTYEKLKCKIPNLAEKLQSEFEKQAKAGYPDLMDQYSTSDSEASIDSDEEPAIRVSRVNSNINDIVKLNGCPVYKDEDNEIDVNNDKNVLHINTTVHRNPEPDMFWKDLEFYCRENQNEETSNLSRMVIGIKDGKSRSDFPLRNTNLINNENSMDPVLKELLSASGNSTLESDSSLDKFLNKRVFTVRNHKVIRMGAVQRSTETFKGIFAENTVINKKNVKENDDLIQLIPLRGKYKVNRIKKESKTRHLSTRYRKKYNYINNCDQIDFVSVLTDDQRKCIKNHTVRKRTENNIERLDYILKKPLKDTISTDLSNNIISTDLSNNIISTDLSNNIISTDLSNNIISRDLSNNIISRDLSNNIISRDLSNNIISRDLSNNTIFASSSIDMSTKLKKIMSKKLASDNIDINKKFEIYVQPTKTNEITKTTENITIKTDINTLNQLKSADKLYNELNKKNQNTVIGHILHDSDPFPLPIHQFPSFRVPGESLPLTTPLTTRGLMVYHAPAPFNVRSGATLPASRINIVRNWTNSIYDRTAPQKIRISAQKCLRRLVFRKLKKSRRRNKQQGLADILANSRFFQRTTIDWVEAALQICQQGHNMLNLLIHKKRLSFVHLDYNFQLKPVKTLSTKERKKARLGNAFHLCRELLKFVKLLVDTHVEYRLGNIDAFQLADGLQYVINHVGILTGMYRYKYKLMRQIRECKDLKHLVYNRFNEGLRRGPGCGFWMPSWRVWLDFLRGTAPLLLKWLGNLLTRVFQGRENKIVKTITKQRVESAFDLELRAAVLRDVTDLMPGALRASKVRCILQHLSEAWRCWKANIPWKVPGMPAALESLLLRYVKSKTDWWTNSAYYNRERIRRGAAVDKAVCRKNAGRLSRLWMKKEHERQHRYLAEGPALTTAELTVMYTTMVQWLEARRFAQIPFPSAESPEVKKILSTTLDRLKNQFAMQSRFNSREREELQLLQQAYENPAEALTKILSNLHTQRVFRELPVQLVDLYTHLVPSYEVEPIEKITDAFLDQYLWYHASQRNLFPNWVKPADTEPLPVVLYRLCEAINNTPDVWSTDEGGRTLIVQAQIEDLHENTDLSFLNKYLRLILDHSLADYMTARHNVVISFKDMSHTNSIGLLKGLSFAPFISQYYAMLSDILLLGLPRAADLAGPPKATLPFGEFSDPTVRSKNPIQLYLRHSTSILILLRLSTEQSRQVTQRYLAAHAHADASRGYGNKTAWSKEQRMQLVRGDTTLGRACFWQFASRLPPSMGSLRWSSAWVSVYSEHNRQLLFSFAQFEVRMVPIARAIRNEVEEGQWKLMSHETKILTASVSLKVGTEGVQAFENRMRQILMGSGAMAFTRISQKWNIALVALVGYFREAVVVTPELLNLLIRSETRVQTRVKVGLNSKMPSRFPPVVFYTPKELGGLGMFSVGYVLVPTEDLAYGATGTHWRSGMSSGEQLIPHLYRYIQSWETEYTDSVRAWAEFRVKRAEAAAEQRRLTVEDLSDSWDRGIPRIYTLFVKDRHALAFDKGWRVRQEYAMFCNGRSIPALWWTHTKHDGRLWNLTNYRTDVIQALGGVEAILEHTLFKATYFPTWEGLFWESSNGFEDQHRYRKLTNAQRAGLSQIPNRRFALWWSPTINRANVYIGFQVQLDLTGVFMHAKLPVLKIALVQLFRSHAWQKTHESIVMDLCQVLDAHVEQLAIEKVSKEVIHPRKSYKFDSSCADIVVTGLKKWRMSEPGQLQVPGKPGSVASRFWIDVQLRWGDYDSHDTDRYAKRQFVLYSDASASLYPCTHGVLIAVDMAYNTYAAYGHFCPGLRDLLTRAMDRIMKVNPSLHRLRDRVRKGLQLYTENPSDTALVAGNYASLFSDSLSWFMDDSAVYRVRNYTTAAGNVATKPLNGAMLVFVPTTGQLFLRIIHASAWAGQKRISQLARWKTAEEAAVLIRSLSQEEQPKQIYCTRRGILDPLEVHLVDFPNVTIHAIELDIPFRAFLHLPAISSEIENAEGPSLLLFNAYDDWLTSVAAYTSFSRLILLLRALSLDATRTNQILKPNSTVATPPSFLWPALTNDEWESVETDLKDLILAEYCKKHNLNVSQLTQNEIRDIILGVEKAAISETDDNSGGVSNMATTTKIVNALGEEVVVSTTTNYESASFQSKTDWRGRAIAVEQLPLRSNTVFVDTRDAVAGSTTYVLPRCLVNMVLRIADLRTQLGAFIYGTKRTGAENIVDITAVVFPPQLGNNDSVKLPDNLPNHSRLESLTLLGLLRTGGLNQESAGPSDVRTLAAYAGKTRKLESGEALILSLTFTPGSCTACAHKLMPQAYAWASSKDGEWQENFLVKVPVVVSSDVKASYFVPRDGIWNYSFSSVNFMPEDEYAIIPDIPKNTVLEVENILD